MNKAQENQGRPEEAVSPRSDIEQGAAVQAEAGNASAAKRASAKKPQPKASEKRKPAAVAAAGQPAKKTAAQKPSEKKPPEKKPKKPSEKKSSEKKPSEKKAAVQKKAPAQKKPASPAKQETPVAVPSVPEPEGMHPAPEPDPIRVLLVASEAMPFVKTGGLADVVGTLPMALGKNNIDARVILPKYRDIPQVWKERMQYLTHFYVQMGWRRQYCGIQFVKHENVTFYFVDNEFYFARDTVYGDGQEEGERFGFFCRAVLEALPHINYFPQILHCNDWQTGLIPVLLRLQYMHLPQYAQIKTLFTIHNLKFQGVFAWKQIDDLFGLGARYYTPDMLEFFGDISFLKAGLVFSDHISTVSPTYAQEIQSPYYGERLDGLLRARSAALTGILNGIDYVVWDPATDYLLENHYDVEHMEGKAACKRKLQQELWLPEDEDAMVVSMVTRLTEQKGLSLIEHVLNEMMQMNIQFVVVGQGERHFCEMLTWAQWRYQGKVAVRFEQNEWLAHTVYAGTDLFLMPSRFEPCGISQMISMRYGAVPLVRETGGLFDTVQPYNKYTDEGTGFSFANYNAHEMLYTLEQAVKYFQDRKLWSGLRQRGMRMKFDWARSAERYRELYERMLSPGP